jgi:Putative phage metallopeptidase
MHDQSKRGRPKASVASRSAEPPAWVSRPIGVDDHERNAASREEYVAAEEPRAIALELVLDPDRHHERLKRVSIDFAFRYGQLSAKLQRQLRAMLAAVDGLSGLVGGDEDAYAKTMLIRGERRYLSHGQVDVLIWFWADLWRASSPAWKRFLVDHELMHIDVEVIPTLELFGGGWTKTNETVEVRLKDHDIAGDFAGAWVRHGIPGDTARALQLARDRVKPLPPLDGQDVLMPPRLLELPPRSEQNDEN